MKELFEKFSMGKLAFAKSGETPDPDGSLTGCGVRSSASWVAEPRRVGGGSVEVLKTSVTDWLGPEYNEEPKSRPADS